MLRSIGLLAATLLLCGAAAAQDKKPPVPAGKDPGGVAVALLTTGIDYTRPAVAQRLARDGEGDLIGWDMAEGDNRPFDRSAGRISADWGGDGTALAQQFGIGGRRIVPVRIDPASPASLARAVAFIARTPARIVVVPMSTQTASDWEAFRQAAAHFSDLLFVIAAGDEGHDIDQSPVWPAALDLPNALVVTAPVPGPGNPEAAPNFGARSVHALVTATRQLATGLGEIRRPPETSREAAVHAADAIAGCWPHLLQAHKGATLKAAVLSEAVKAWPGNPQPVIERCMDNPAAPNR